MTRGGGVATSGDTWRHGPQSPALSRHHSDARRPQWPRQGPGRDASAARIAAEVGTRALRLQHQGINGGVAQGPGRDIRRLRGNGLKAADVNVELIRVLRVCGIPRASLPLPFPSL